MKKRILQVISYVLVAAAASAATLFLFHKPESYSKLTELQDVIDYYFIGDYDETVIEDAAAESMVAALGDRWSYYIPQKDYAAYTEQMENAYVGVGMTITEESDIGFLVVSVTKGGSAEEAGVLPGDVLIEIAGSSTAPMSTTEARNLVRGEEGTTIHLVFSRNGERHEFDLERRYIETPVAAAKMLDDTTGLVTIYNFDTRCASESIAAIDSLLSQGATQLIFDVRNNPGGYAHELVKLLDYLLPEGDLFRTVDYAGNEKVDRSDASCLQIPMVVLVNEDSYSAAEFFGAALRDYDWAKIVGTQTCGKGYFQTTYQLSDGSAVGISIGKYFTPKNVSLAETGVTPDVIVEVDEETAWQIAAEQIAVEDDPQLQAAMALLKE